jgi:hypothetical protein
MIKDVPLTPWVEPPVTVPLLFLDPQKVTEAHDRAARRETTPLGAQEVVELLLEQLHGSYVINRYRILYNFSFCPLKSDITGDKISLTNSKKVDSSIIFIDGRAESVGCLNDEPTHMYQGQDRRDIANMMSQSYEVCRYSSEVAVFSKDQAMKLETPVMVWTDNPGDQLDITLSQDLLIVPVTLWVMVESPSLAPLRGRPPLIFRGRVQSIARDPRGKQALEDLGRAYQVFNGSKCGITFDTTDPSGLKHEYLIEVPVDREELLGASCDESPSADDLKTKIGYEGNRLNVYYLDQVGNLSPPKGVWCTGGYEDMILISAKISDHESLAHEFGHALGLERHANRYEEGRGNLSADFDGDGKPDFAQDNLMWAAGTQERKKLSKGQCFRCNVHTASYLHWRQPPLATLPGRKCFEKTNYLEPDPSCPHMKLDAD